MAESARGRLDPLAPSPLHNRASADRPGEWPRLSRISHATLHDRVYEELRDALMNGQFLPGEALTIRRVAEALGTSVMPVREALRRLAAARAVQFHADRSIRIPLLTDDGFEELLQMRLLLEGRAAAAAAEAITPSELETVREFNTAFMDLGGGGAPIARLVANRHFHFAIYRAARAPLLFSLIEMMWLQSGPYLMIPSRRAAPDEVTSYFASGALHHRDLLDALAKRAGKAAAAAVRADISDAARAYRELLAARVAEESAGQRIDEG